MDDFAGIMLLINAAFNVIVWPRFWTRITKDERAHDAAGRATKFLVVHAILISAALIIAAVSGVGGVLALLQN